MTALTYEGEIKSQRTVPKLVPGYATKTYFALSEFGTEFVYFDDNTYNLNIYDLATSQTRVLRRNICDSPYLKKIKLFSNNRLITIVERDRGKGNYAIEINRVDTLNGKVIASNVFDGFPPIGASSYIFSKSGKYLVFFNHDTWDGISRYVQVYDLETVKLVARMPSSIFGRPAISPDEKFVACLNGCNLIMMDIETVKIRSVKTLPPRYSCGELEFLDNRTLLYFPSEMGTDQKFTLNPATIDVISGEEKSYPAIPLNGDVYVIDNGKKILCEEGYF